MKVRVLRTLSAKEYGIPVYCQAGMILEGDKSSFPKCVQNALNEDQNNLVQIIAKDPIKVSLQEPDVAKMEDKIVNVSPTTKPVADSIIPVSRKRRGR